jgi:hypothetical protein
VATAGDVNGDGFSDVIVGARFYDDGQVNEGRAFVYHGWEGGLASAPAWTAEGNQADAEFGYSVATAGDVNGDGFSDVIVGAYLYDNGQETEGRAFVYHGSAAGLASTPAWTAESDQSGAAFANSVATAGDVNADGFSDVIVGAASYENGQTAEGRAFVYHGSATGLASTAAWTAESNQVNAYFGWSVATAGDVNGDGFSDVIVGAEQYTNGQTDEGAAFVFHGSAAGLASTPAWIGETNQAIAFCNSAATAGDVNGDGFSDVILGASSYSNGVSAEGRAFVYHGSATGLASTAAWTVESNQPNAYLGRSVAAAGDVNGDGFSDVIVGAYLYDDDLQIDKGRAWVYHGSAAGLATVGAWTASSNQAGAWFGYSVATAGDVNGDGFSDVIVGAHRYDNGQADEGQAFVYHGAAAGLATTPSWDFESNQASAQFGWSVSTAGDVNGDGFSDVIVGAHSYDNGQTDEGRAFVYHGSAAGLATTPSWSFESNQVSALFGWSVAAAGDVNGDGFSDVIVGARAYDNGQSDEGRAFVYHGSTTGLGSTPAWTAESDQAGANFGYSVATAGDVNGDGFSDVIVGAEAYDNGQTNEGRALVYLGSATGLASTPAWTAESDQAGARFGISVASAGDVNGDEFSDVIVGAWSYDNGQVNEGRAFVYHGSAAGLASTPAWAAESNQAGAVFGRSVASAGDVNGDSFSDVIVGAEDYDNGQDNEGRAFVYHGSAAGLASTPDWTAELDAAEAGFGFSTATAGDANGDGFSDVFVSAYNFGWVWVYYGSPAGLAWFSIVIGPQSDAWFGYSVAPAGDVNGDGFSDVIAGAPAYDGGQTDEGGAFLYYGNEGPGRTTQLRQLRTDGTTPIARLGWSDSPTQFQISGVFSSIYGRTPLQVEGEVKPIGVLFDGQNTSTAFPSFIDTGADGQVGFTFPVTGLSPGTQYHWRVRAKYDLVRTPFQPNGPWMQMPVNGWNETDLRTADIDPATPVETSAATPEGFQLFAAGPNPFAGSCRVRLALDRPTRVSASVFDVQGRAVATLAEDRPYPAGSHVLSWDGRDRSGSPAAAGVYFLRAAADGQARVWRAVLMR